MNKKFRLIGFAALMTIAAISFTACGGASEAPTEEVEVEVVDDATVVEEVEETVEAEEVIEADSTATEGKCGEGKCGEGKCG